MKKTDIAMIILIASVGVMVSYLVAQSIPALQHDKERTEQVISANEVSPELVEVDKRVFNDKAINPTVEIIIGKK